MEIKTFNCLPDEAIEIRKAVFIDEQGFENEFDEIDNIATHLVAFEDSLPVATCRFYKDEKDNNFIVGRIAVIPDFRENKIGGKILAQAEKEVIKSGGDALYLFAQCRAAVFYEKQGYEKTDITGFDEGCPHVWMYKKLK